MSEENSNTSLWASSVFAVFSAGLTMLYLRAVGLKGQHYEDLDVKVFPITGIVFSLLAIMVSLYSLVNHKNKLLYVYYIILSIINMVVLIAITRKKPIKISLSVSAIIVDTAPVIVGICFLAVMFLGSRAPM